MSKPEIFTEFEEENDSDKLDNGVEKEVTAEEDFVAHGERVERETNLTILEDGGVHISQRVQGCYDALTLNAQVVRRLVSEVESDE